jgi:monoamine oxidase
VGAISGPLLAPGVGAAQAAPGATRAPVLVIGGGPAGITAAYFLKKAGIDAIVLEGNDRVGGRVLTSTAWPDTPVDLGASWMSHAEWSPLAALVKQWGIKTAASDLFNFSLRTADGVQLSEAEIARLFGLYGQTYLAAKEIAAKRQLKRLPDIPASDAFARVMAAQKLSGPDFNAMNWFLTITTREPWASPLCDLSLYHWDQNLEFDFVQNYVFPQGYVQFINHMIAEQDLDVRLNHLVREVDYSPRGVFVSTTRGEFFAPYAIVTLPLGILRSGSVKFSPPLPAWKRAAIKRLHFGLADKFYIRFPSVFWDPDHDGVNRIANSEDQPWAVWINFYKYLGKPILMVFNEGDYARQLEDMTDTQVLDAAMSVLRDAYGRSIPDPIDLQRSRWAQNPFSLGSVAHVPPGASGADFDLIGKPVPDDRGRLLFAGDSTIGILPCLVLTAFLSGQREAERIIRAVS